MPRLRDVGEAEVLRRLIAAASPVAGARAGPGDDAAVLALSAGCELVATTDAFVEGRHFIPAIGTPGEHGARLAAANLSDLAASAARPRWALLSMGLRPDHDLDALLELQAGVARALAPLGAGIVGGNLAAVEGAEWFDLTLMGEAPSGKAWTRRGARPGDLIAVTGHPGRAAAALGLLRADPAAAAHAEWKELIDAWRAPAPRVNLARALAEAGAVRAAIDVSDGLAGDLARLAEASGIGIELASEGWWRDEPLMRAADALGVPAVRLRLGPSDDYELILAISPECRDPAEGAARAHGTPFAFVGSVVAEAGVRLGGRALPVEGFDHFRAT